MDKEFNPRIYNSYLDNLIDQKRRFGGKVLGSGGYAFVNLTEEEELKFNLGVLQLFFGNIGRLGDKRLRYYCNKCSKEYPGSPQIEYDYPNEEVGEGVVLVEKENTNVSSVII